MPTPANEHKPCRWGDNGFCPTIDGCYYGGCRGPVGKPGIGTPTPTFSRMPAARLELIEQQMQSGFCWHIHAQELLAEVLRLRHLEWFWKQQVPRETSL